MMTLRNKILVTAAMFLTGCFSFALIGNSGGADPGNTAAPGENENACARLGCHVGTGNPARDTGVEIQLPDGLTYTPGVRQRWQVRVTGATGAVYGFQVSARQQNNSPAGAFNAADARTQVLCADGRTPPCRADAPQQYITHVLADARNSFEFDWTPPATDVGPVRVFAAGNAANGNGQSTGDRIFLRNFTLTPRAAQTQRPTIRSDRPILQVFSATPVISPGTWIEIYGQDLSTVTRSWTGSDFQGTQAPTELNGVKVKVAGRSAFVSYISPTQVNVQVPDGIGTGDGIEVEVENTGGTARTSVRAAAVSPALLTTPLFNVDGRQYVAALHTDLTTFVGRANLIAGVPFRPARPGDRIIIYAVGCGPTEPASPPGQIISGIRRLSSPFTVRMGNSVATAEAFMELNLVGLCRFDVTVPNLGAGDVPLEVTVAGVANGQNLFTTIQP
jgi:uncharacterized protein (TIGR03437 family)